MKRIVFVIAMIGVLAACRSSRTLGRAVGKKDTTARTVVPMDTQKRDTQQNIRNTLQKLQSNRINFTSFSGKVGVDYKGTDGNDDKTIGSLMFARMSIPDEPSVAYCGNG